jgi:serine/threonine protein kinase
MREVVFADPMTQLKNQQQYNPAFIEFLKSCLVKDPKTRPNAEDVLKLNKKFFALAKDKKYIKENLLKGVPTVEERV